jgi:ferredoxin-NADP reductase
MIPVKIASIRRETPTIKSFMLDLNGQAFSFKPGQWIDCYADINVRHLQGIVGGAREIAGYSITTSPLETNDFGIAVKLVGDNPVTNYMHESARIGNTLYVDGGHGDFFYERGIADSITLIAGGIGITPLMSIMRYVDEIEPNVRASLFYSAKSPSELAFHDELFAMAYRHHNTNVVFTVTQQSDEQWDGYFGRIDESMLKAGGFDPNDMFFVCGPPSMIQNMIALLKRMGADDSRIRYEQWW